MKVNNHFPVSVQEQKIIEGLRQLPPSGIKEVEDFVVFLAARNVSWSYGDPKSTARAVNLMAQDPFMQREMQAINEEFRVAEADGLEDY
jgi:hypothetical protein